MKILLTSLFFVALIVFPGCFSSELADAPAQYAWQPSRTTYLELEEMYGGETVEVMLVDGTAKWGPLSSATRDSIVLYDSAKGFRWSAAMSDVAFVRHFNHLVPCLCGAGIGGAAGMALAGLAGNQDGMHPTSASSNDIFTGGALGALAGGLVGVLIPMVYEYDVNPVR